MTKEYREGCDPEPEEVAEEASNDTAEKANSDTADAKKEEATEVPRMASEENRELPITAFLVIVVDHGRAEAVIDLPPGIPRKRDASIRDVRDACMSLAEDAKATLTAQGSAEVIKRSLARAAEDQFVRNMKNKVKGGVIQ